MLKKISQLVSIIALVTVLFSCGKDDVEPENLNKAPENAITAPQNNATIDFGTTITITANVLDADGTIENVTFYFDSNVIGVVTTAPFTMDFNTTNTPEGTYAIKTIAKDNNGATTESQVVVNIVKSTALEIVNVTQDITSDQTWLSGKIYKLSSNLKIEATLTIEPGCIIKVPGYIKVDGGKIIANGTADKPIIFTSVNNSIGGDQTSDNPKIGDWDYIELNSSGSVFNYCIIEYGEETFTDYSKDLSYTITNCIFRHGYYGINLDRTPASDTKIDNNRFYSNTYPMLITPFLPIGTTNTFVSEDGATKNTYQCINLVVVGLTPSTLTINKDLVFEETELAYYCPNYIEITNNSTFTLGNDVILKMGGIGNRNIEIISGSTFTMSAGSYVTSYHDDTKLGDSDYSNVTPSNEDWYGVREGSTYKTNMPNVLYSKYSSGK